MPFIMKKTLENHVQQLRKAKNMTQADLAHRVAVTRQTIIAIEKGKYTPSVALALDLAKQLEVSVEQLFYEK